MVPGEPREFAEKASVEDGDQVQIRVRVAGAAASGTPIRLSLARGPHQRLDLGVATVAGRTESTAEAVIRSASEDPIRLEGIRYICSLPPRTVCPAEDIQVNDDGYALRFSVLDKAPPIIITGLIQGEG